MCTLSWQAILNETNIFFNYDGKKEEKKKSLYTAKKEDVEVNFISEVEELLSTRLAVNNFGIAALAMNIYHAPIDKEKTYRPIDEIIPQIIYIKTIPDILTKIHEIKLGQYPPFILGCFALSKNPIFIMSDGKHLGINGEITPPISTSSFQTVNVIKERAKFFKDLFKDLNPKDSSYHNQFIDNLLKYHQSQNEESPFKGVCMKREDAETKSFSSINLNPNSISLLHFDGPPLDGEEITKKSKVLSFPMKNNE